MGMMPLDLSFKSALGKGRSDASRPMWQGVHVLAAAALALRLAVACRFEQFDHPDALFQYLEQAHRLVYGYGFIPWEYRFGVRNWLLPGALAGLLAFFRFLGLDQPTFYVPLIKSTFAILSVSMVYASYVTGRNLFGEQTARLAAVFAAFWYELIAASVLATPEVLGAYAVFGSLALLSGAPGRRRTMLAGLLLGTAVALRVQYALPAGALWAVVVLARGWRSARSAGVAGAAALACAGALDAWTWGLPFMSFYNYIDLNVVKGVSLIFGQEPMDFYLGELMSASSWLYAIAVAGGVLTWRKSWPVLLLVACVLVPHSLLSHKEYRFVFLAVPLLLLLLAATVAEVLPRLWDAFGTRPARAMAIVAVLAVSAVTCVTGEVFERDGRLLAALDLSRRDDVSAVLDLTGEWTESGGFYYLHRNVPYYFEEHVEGLPATDIRQFVSHVVAPADETDIPGFRLAASYGDVAILEQVSPPASYRRLAKDGREPREPRVEDHLPPTVWPRPHS
jgi:GPI mannosyltransferase 3